MIISHKNKFIFFKPMKCAGSSLEHSLWRACGPEDLCTGGTPQEQTQGYVENNNRVIVEGRTRYRFHTHVWPSLFYEQTDRHLWHDYRKISVARNPWDAVVSWYWWSMARTNNRSSLEIDECDNRSKAQVKFGEFLETIYLHPSMKLAGGSTECTPLDYISAVNEEFISDVDVYAKYESLEDDYAKLCDDLNIERFELMTFKSTQRKIKNHYSYYYTPKSRQLVESKFPNVLSKFEYKFQEVTHE